MKTLCHDRQGVIPHGKVKFIVAVRQECTVAILLCTKIKNSHKTEGDGNK
ncbi:hypothetical protein HMPREF0105_3159 [Bacteroides sp. 3_1_33FAA]|uniref:Uncharacterized protein n=1 Tax=Phocaeicola dorei DSM 17855 TaxID=483217 RepID=B6VS87_9BACT|nr:hypothetical protein BACDOR_00117 [Phocaeicola dorei DSM 17855]EEZ20568.1 hypothetical protein HMPREF0105_3159 [Bacteroides sp. 3_1_33FAA]